MVEPPENVDPVAAQPHPLLQQYQYVIPAVALVVSIVFGVLQLFVPSLSKPRVRLDTELLSQVVIADLARQPAKKLKLLYGEEELKNATIVSLLVRNAGTETLTLYEKELEHIYNPRIVIEFAENVRILEAEVHPIGADASTVFESLSLKKPNIRTFAVRLMNVDAEAQVDLVVAGYSIDGKLSVTPLGKGVKGTFVKKRKETGEVLGIYWMVFVVFFGLGSAILGEVGKGANLTQRVPLHMGLSAVLALAMTFIVWILVRWFFG